MSITNEKRIEPTEGSKHSINNRPQIEASEAAGCFYCCKIYPASDIHEWIDNGTTALCPQCGIDSVLGDTQTELSENLLQEMHKYAFS